jgi:hypothetical protein
MSPNETLDLSIWRRQAPEASGGTSSDEIYSMIEETLTDFQLGGRIVDYGAGLGNLSKRLLSMRRFESLYAADIVDKPEGLAGVEWLRALISLVVRGHYVAFNDPCCPAHVTAPPRKDLSRILQEAEFKPARFRFTQAGAVPGLTRFTWQGVSRGLLRGINFSDSMFAVAQKPL